MGGLRVWDATGHQVDSLPRQLYSDRGVCDLALTNNRIVVTTYYGDVVLLTKDGHIDWRKDLTPLCYPEPHYEPRFLRGQ